MRNSREWNGSRVGIRRIFENNKIKNIEFKFEPVVTEFTVSVKSVKCQISRKIKKWFEKYQKKNIVIMKLD